MVKNCVSFYYSSRTTNRRSKHFTTQYVFAENIKIENFYNLKHKNCVFFVYLVHLWNIPENNYCPNIHCIAYNTDWEGYRIYSTLKIDKPTTFSRLHFGTPGPSIWGGTFSQHWAVADGLLYGQNLSSYLAQKTPEKNIPKVVSRFLKVETKHPIFPP